MPRQARIDAPGALHHIMVRGIERKKIFRDNKDRDSFLTRLGKILSETSTPCYAWALIPNHAHLLMRTGSAPLSHVMRRLLTGYAVRFNHRYRRHGKLFQNRYKSILCQEDPYLLELVRYIRLKGDERILGDSDYVLDVLKENRERFERRYELKARWYNLDVLTRRVAEIFHVRPEEIFSPGKYKKRVQARSVLSDWAVRELGETASYIAKKIGISQPVVSLSVERGERIVKEMGLDM